MEFFLGVLSSLIASVFFISLLSRIRPKIQICEKIAHVQKEGDDGYFQIKVINRSPRTALEVKWQLHAERPDAIRGTDAWVIKRIPLLTDEIFALTGHSGQDDGNTFYFTLRTQKGINLFEYLSDERTRLRFRVLCRDEYTQFSRLTARYFSKADIIPGVFDVGRSDSIRAIEPSAAE